MNQWVLTSFENGKMWHPNEISLFLLRAKSEEQIERVMGATVGKYGGLQGIAGKSLQEIEGLSFPALEDGTAPL